MIKLLLALGALTVTLQLNAITLNKIYVDKSTNYTITDSSIGQINGYLVFNQITNFEIPFKQALYAMDIESQEITKLANGKTFNFSSGKPYIRIGNYLYFMNTTDNGTTVWRTDGTQAGTTQIYANQIQSEIRASNGLLYFYELASGQLVTFDGNQIVNHPITDTFFDVEDVCALANDDFIAIGAANDIDGPYIRSTSGDITALDLELLLTTNGYEVNLTSHNGNCYTYLPNAEGGSDIWKLTSDNDPQSLMTLPNDFTVGMLSHQNNLYIRQINDQFLGLKIFRLSADETMIDASYGDINSQELAITDWASIGEFVAIRTTTPTASPSVDSIFILSPNLNELPQYQYLFPTKMPQAFESSDGWVLQTSQFYNGVKEQNRLLFNLASNNPLNLLLPEGAAYQFTSDPNQSRVYMLAYDGLKTTLYQTADQPDIGPIITGGWYNPNIENQGLNIIQGTRFNGSDYVSVTGYTYKDGLPFWFAGNADIQAPQNSIDIELFEFSGIGMFEPNITPERLPYGTINLQMNGCNELNSTITTANDVFEMLLYRADDVSFTRNCVD